MPLVFRKATIDDIPAVIALQERIWEPTYRDILSSDQIEYMFTATYSAESLADQMTRQGHQFLLALQDHEPVGFASYSRTDAAGERYKLHKIYVLPSEQGKGTGRLLLEETAEKCRAAGGERLILNVNRYNRARHFYERMGFAVIREEDVPIGPYWMNDYVMEKIL
ncbi:GNAT family N-acetyltransferase [Larkinella soli]|uniref:GNAT family N-acetyltransferase n=1 Tax=Larkinella soli TaxID=1770527 RepID=UPI000FFBDFA4|nr:GNAT family N-acetyltransferase [Larkinella soli]